jgi:hypothetical protein
LDPDRVKEAGERAQSLSKRFDEFIERRKINDAAEDEHKDEDLDVDPQEEELLLEPAVMEATSSSDLHNPEVEDEPWFS